MAQYGRSDAGRDISKEQDPERGNGRHLRSTTHSPTPPAVVGIIAYVLWLPTATGKAPLPAGTKYLNPENPAEFYVAGKGRPPGWFETLRAKGGLPMPEAANDNMKPVAVQRAL
jgi:hypothetical protein